MPENLGKPSVPASWMPASLEEAEQRGLKNQPTLKSATADLESRRKAKDVAASAFMPRIDIDAEQSWNDQSDHNDDYTDETKVMLNLRYNLFNGWKDKARNAEAAYLVNEARSIRNHTHRKVIESIQLSWRSFKASENRLPYLKKRVEYAKATAVSYNKQWGIGKRTLLDVLNTQAERISAEKEQLNTEYDLLYSQFRVLSGTGQLVEGLGAEYPQESMIEESQTEDKEEATESPDISIHKIIIQPSFQSVESTVASK
jgi:adhesin transport system outer membrane protein